jgi:hypothetical protein
MSSINIDAKEIVSSVSRKLKLQNIRTTRELHGDYYLDGKFQFQVTMPNPHGAKKSISTGWLKVCRNSVRLSSSEYAALVRCLMTGDEYDNLIREQISSQT